MNLADRLAAAHGEPAPSLSAASTSGVPVPRPSVVAAVPPPPVDALARLKDRVGKALFERMGSRMNDPNLSAEQLRTIVLGELDEVVEEENVPLSTEERDVLLLHHLVELAEHDGAQLLGGQVRVVHPAAHALSLIHI